MTAGAFAGAGDQTAADHARVVDVGTIGYCPVCRRPASSEPLPAGEAMRRVGAHLLTEHDGYFAAMLGVALAAGARSPFYPADDRW